MFQNGTTSIPGREYLYCYNITGVTFNTDGALNVIGQEAFRGAGNLGEVTIPASVTILDYLAFVSSNVVRFVFDTTNGPSMLTTIGSVIIFMHANIILFAHLYSVSFFVFSRTPCPLTIILRSSRSPSLS